MSIRIAGFPYGIVQQLGDALETSDPSQDHTVSIEKLMEQGSATVGQWVGMLDLGGAVVGPAPFQLNLSNNTTPTPQEWSPYLFSLMLEMTQKLWGDEDIYALYRDNARTRTAAADDVVNSARQYRSFRQIHALRGRRLYIINSGAFGLCPKTTQVGDFVVFLFGSQVPIVLRLIPSLHVWVVVGEAYVPGYMNGEIFDPDLETFRYGQGVGTVFFPHNVVR